MHVPIDWLVVTAFVAWVVEVVFAFAWYRKWDGWSSHAFAATVALSIGLPVVLVAWLGSGFSPDEQLNRILRSRVYVLSLATRNSPWPIRLRASPGAETALRASVDHTNGTSIGANPYRDWT
jgi:hypothetical protein